MEERHGAATFQSNPLTLMGQELKPGVMAPDFEAIDMNMAPVRLKAFSGRVRVILSVPSLDTEICHTECTRFNELSKKVPADTSILTVSMDLPFALERWCLSTHSHELKLLSDHRKGEFGMAYGVLIKELRLLSRAVFLVDQEGILTHTHYIKEMSEQPDYDLVMRQVRELHQ